ncbi:MAG: ribose 5-phosphate isomerase B [Kosmotoga sp.]|jgi:ribose 5-phosphate isomerase B|nr:MAG: ribose 5-phosphate isomerase B [Kosmotoga sp.]
MKIALGSDHAGFKLKEHVKKYLSKKGIDVIDYGTDSDRSVDYPDYGKKVAKAVQSAEVDRGIVICGTGIGVSMVANKYKNVRAALCLYPKMAEMARRHNNANVLAMGGRLVAPQLALDILDVFLKTNFEGGKHKRRVDKIDDK